MFPPVILEDYIKKLLDSLPPGDVTKLPQEDFRDLFWHTPAGTVLPDVQVRDTILPTSKGDVSVTIARPTTNDTLPCIVYFHGGGWFTGNKYCHALIMRELAVQARAAVVFVNYSLSPEVKYPVAMEECYSVVEWLANSKNAASLQINAHQLAVAGDSAGGNFATVISLLAKRRGLGKAIKYQVLYYPVTNDNFATESYETFQDGFLLTRNMMKFFFDQYTTEEDRLLDTVCPLKASTEDLLGLPPALVITAEADVLRDEGEAYARKLMQAGVKVVATRYLGLIHGFFTMSELTTQAQAALTQTVVELHKAWNYKA
ncbi:alpha/beta hydrolase fold-domain-containing protein [Radiomyces spectabilis]|uniref:alpha/beta hydrolase fold-domain-containing protein n=1 Tax=Radiomyces spectabilis TaxID=64574 RepID=UPI0022208CD7|nr:alpha/beta hydrolase fold-domain-containing protein [Radiomyces spectabilis]KAI8368242.1 alpha/beta hydrolase fold-domain-containing protein [Radiomyces spectabilis]